MPDGFRTGFVQVGGLRLFYRLRGKPEKGTVLLVHGGPSAGHVLLLPFADLAQFGYRVVWYDQSGCGRSQRPWDPANYTLPRRADEAEGVRRALGLGKVHLNGTSFGVPIALETALRHPSGLLSLSLSDGFSSTKELYDDERRHFAEAPKRIRSIIERFESQGDLKDARYLKARKEYESLPRHTSEGRPALLSTLRVRPWEVVEMWETLNPRIDRLFYGDQPGVLSPPGGSMKDWEVTSRLKEIRLPTLVSVGRFDSVDVRFSRRIHRGIRGSKLVIFEKSAHGPLFSERDLYMETQRDFLDRVVAHTAS
ncbi:MAG: proline iminopeptidase-family hydrolase [Thermoplasmata archaeon]|nr:proline iminopeptidase-family hydrolase [Thermoplasmata archaeon]